MVSGRFITISTIIFKSYRFVVLIASNIVGRKGVGHGGVGSERHICSGRPMCRPLIHHHTYRLTACINDIGWLVYWYNCIHCHYDQREESV